MVDDALELPGSKSAWEQIGIQHLLHNMTCLPALSQMQQACCSVCIRMLVSSASIAEANLPGSETHTGTFNKLRKPTPSKHNIIILFQKDMHKLVHWHNRWC